MQDDTTNGTPTFFGKNLREIEDKRQKIVEMHRLTPAIKEKGEKMALARIKNYNQYQLSVAATEFLKANKKVGKNKK
jgi:hypothetical protein